MSNLIRALIIFALSLPASAQSYFAYNGQCAKGGQEVLVQNQASKGTTPIGGTLRTLTSGVIASYPGCTVSVFITGTLTPAAIYSNRTGKVMVNPFIGNTDGSFLFFAAAGGYDVTLAGAGMPATVTLTGIQLGTSGGPPGPPLSLSTNGTLNGNQTLLNLANGSNVSVSDNGQGTVTISATGVITGATPNSGLIQTGTTLGFNPCPNGQILKSTGTAWGCSTFLSGPTLQTNGTNNAVQSQLNLSAGTNITITDNGSGTDTFSVPSPVASPQYSLAYYPSIGTSPTVTGLPAPTTPNGVPQLAVSIPSGSAAQPPIFLLPGVAGRAVTGATSTDTILSSDCSPNRIEYTGSVAVAVTLPTATTLAVPNCVFKISNQTSPSQTVTVTPTTWTVNGAPTLAIPSGSVATFYVDPLGTNWNADVPASASSALTGSGTANTIPKWTGASSLGNSSVTDDGTNPTRTPNGSNVALGPGAYEVPNNASTGTVLNKLACNDGAGLAINCSHTTSTTNQIFGVVVGGAGTTGNAIVCTIFRCSVTFDNTSTAKHWCISSPTVDGDCHDNGSTSETAGQPNISVDSANSGAGTLGNVKMLTQDSISANSACPTCVTIASPATGVLQLSGATRAATSSTALANGTTATTQAALDNSTKVSTTAYTDTAVSNGIAAVNPAVAVLAASTANLTGTYAQVGGGVGDTFTITATGVFTLDGIAINTIGQRVLFKNQSTASQNGVYTATIPGSIGVSAVFTRALDYDTPSDVNNTGIVPVQSGTVNATTSWLLISQVTSIGSAGSALTYAQFSVSPTSLVHGLAFSIYNSAGLTSGTTGIANYTLLTVPFACTIQAYNLVIDTGTITVKFWKVATGTAIPTVSNSISTSGVSIASGTAIHSATLTDFTTTTVAANDIMAMDITAVSGANFVNGVLQCQ